MADLHDGNCRGSVLNQVQNPVVSLADPILFFAREPFRAGWTRVGPEALNLGGEALPVLLRSRFQLFGRGRLDQKAIACQAA